MKDMRNGYIALMTALVISGVVMLISASIAYRSASSRVNSLGYELEDISYHLAYSCLEEAIINSRASSSYTGNEIVSVGSQNCTILTLQSTTTGQLIKTTATYQGKETNLQSIYSTGTVDLITVNKVAQF